MIFLFLLFNFRTIIIDKNKKFTGTEKICFNVKYNLNDIRYMRGTRWQFGAIKKVLSQKIKNCRRLDTQLIVNTEEFIYYFQVK